MAFIAAILGVTWLWIELSRHDVVHTDFSPVWFGAKALLDGRNPYPLVGPGREFDWPWTLLYPVPALAAAIPLAWLPETTASMIFVFVSTFLLAFGMTRHSWHLLPIFASQAFVDSARLAQWSLIFTAALFLPALAFLAVAKPQAGIPVLAASSKGGLKAGIIGALVLGFVSFLLLPQWPAEWTRLLGQAGHMSAPITQLGGFAVLLLLLRWRRKDAWLVMTMACVPQSWGWYNILMLLTVAATFREAAALVLLSTIAAILGPYVVGNLETSAGFYSSVGALHIATAYLPATLLILRRPNEGDVPAWLSALLRIAAHLRRKAWGKA